MFTKIRSVIKKHSHVESSKNLAGARNKPRSEVITLLNWSQFRRDKLPLFMPGQDMNRGAWIGGACLSETVTSLIKLLLQPGFCFFSNWVRTKNCTIESTNLGERIFITIYYKRYDIFICYCKLSLAGEIHQLRVSTFKSEFWKRSFLTVYPKFSIFPLTQNTHHVELRL